MEYETNTTTEILDLCHTELVRITDSLTAVEEMLSSADSLTALQVRCHLTGGGAMLKTLADLFEVVKVGTQSANTYNQINPQDN